MVVRALFGYPWEALGGPRRGAALGGARAPIGGEDLSAYMAVGYDCFRGTT